MGETVSHESIGPVFDNCSRVLILGTIPSPKSRAAGFYYGHPQNRFWRVLCAVLEEPFAESAEQRRALVLRRHIALWDVLARCEIDGASDASIRNPVANDMRLILSKSPVRAVFTTGTTAARLYHRLCAPVCGVAAAPLPSTSPANCRRQTVLTLTEAYRVILPFLE